MEVTLPFDRKTLVKDVLLAISQAIEGKSFQGHDGRDYLITRNLGQSSGRERFIDLVITTEDGHRTTVATYGMVLIGISRTQQA